jgi:hypothetical protein
MLVEKNLKFREDGTFTIVQFTDLHWRNDDEKDQSTRSLMTDILQSERPDLIVFTGDIIHDKHCEDSIQSLRGAVQAAEDAQTPWAAVLGNHDAEFKVSKEQLMEVLQEGEYGIAEPGPEEIHGIGNYVLTLSTSDGARTCACLYLLDSGDYGPEPVKGFAWIHHDQTAWYRERSAEMTQQNNGIPLPALAFFHLPLPEYEEVWDKHTCCGQRLEGIGCPKVNSGFFASVLEMGDIMGTFVGHCHVNDYYGDLFGVRLSYGRATGLNGYGREGFLRGARIIRLRQDERGFESWLRLEDGSVDRQPTEHLPAITDTQKATTSVPLP